jgi:CO/xanthine dehydrogenase FAD-binding subunit
MAELFRPADLDEAIAVAGRLSGVPVTVAAGCTDLFPARGAGPLAGPVLDLSGVAALQGISRGADGGVRIGAMTTWAAIRDADLPPAFDALRQAAAEVGSPQIQAAGTIGGNLCNASPAADGVPCLMALDARVEVASGGGLRVLALGDFLAGPRRTVLAAGEILTAVLVPGAAVAGASAFEKLGARRYMVISVVMAVARIVADGGRVAGAALSVGAASPVAVRLGAVEAALAGAHLDEAAGRVDPSAVAAALSPIGDVRADAGYRRGAAAEVLRRAVTRAAQAAGERTAGTQTAGTRTAGTRTAGTQTAGGRA